MDTFPSSMEEGNRTQNSSLEGRLWWALGIVIMCAVVWLWATWLRGTFPFSSEITVIAPEKIEQQLSGKDVIASLTSTATSSAALSPSVLKSLTSSPVKKNAKPIESAVLDSLTSKK